MRIIRTPVRYWFTNSRKTAQWKNLLTRPKRVVLLVIAMTLPDDRRYFLGAHL